MLWTNGIKVFCTVLFLLPFFLLLLIFSPFSFFLLTLESVLLYLCLLIFIFLPFLFLLNFHFLRIFLFSSPYPRFLYLFTTSPFLFCFSSSSVFLTHVSYLLLVKFLRLILFPLHHLIHPLYIRIFATVNYATLNCRLWWRYHWHCLCHLYLFGILTVSSTILVETKWHSFPRCLSSFD
jgi:hypothetical protein